MKRLKTILQSRYLFKVLCVIFIFYSLLIAFVLPKESKYLISDNVLEGKVVSYEIDGSQLELTLKGKEKVIIYYYFDTEEEKKIYENGLELGMILKVTGELTRPTKNTIPNGFNYKKYLYYQGVYYFMNAIKVEKISNNTSVLYYVKNKMVDRIEKIDDTGYLSTFILGDKTLMDDQVVEVYRQNGLSHLFSVSGMHVSLIVGIIMFILNKVSYNNFYKYSVVSLVLIFYLFLTDCSASILRTVIMFIVFAVNKCFNLKMKRFDLMLVVLIVAVMLEPLIIYNMGFQFSYSISFVLVMVGGKINLIKSRVLKSLYTSFICFLVSFPICIYYFSEVNILSIFLNLIMIPIVSLIIFPMTLITFICPFIYPVYEFLVFGLEKVSELMGSIDYFTLVLAKPSLWIVVIYYVVIFLAIFKEKYLIIFLILIFFHKGYVYYDRSFLLAFLDVGQGDSIFIKMPNNEGNILIDTGGILSVWDEDWKRREKEYSVVESNLIPYFKRLGVVEIDYLILTHGDFDHMGEAINLVNNFKVEKVICNCGEFNDLEKELITVLDKKKIPYYSCIKELNIDDNKLYFLNSNDYGNENDNSSVIYTELNNYKFLFMGDAGVEVEAEIISKYNLKNLDVLKVGHHGSGTSSSQEFIDEITPNYSIISVGKNNRYGHPNKEVLKTLEESKIYRTDKQGSIIFKIKNDKLKIEMCAP